MPLTSIKELIQNQAGTEVLKLAEPYLAEERRKNIILATSTVFNIVNQPEENYQTIVNLKRINDVRYINKFFEAINAKLCQNGIYINSVETYTIRKIKILSRFPAGLNWIIYSIDVLFKRVCPKLPITKQLYFYMTQGHNRVLSKAETLGRLYSCGFEVIEEVKIGNELYFVSRKIKEPVFDENPTYGPLIRLKRYGKNGRIIGVYKARTMHAYSEYLQEYIFEKNHLDVGGKFNNDFRVTTLGRFLRKFWLDELPMLINLFNGDLKLVGVRPLSSQYLSLYNENLKQKRIKHKPGLIPPYYADMPKTLDEIQNSERVYLESYEVRPFTTDCKYFWKALVNIVFKRARSK